jgi:plastocyanin
MSRVLASLSIALVAAFSLVLGPAPAAPADASDVMTSTGGAGAAIPGCGRGQQNVGAPAISGLPTVTVAIHDGFFLPEEITVPAGTRVVWTNNGSGPHTTTAWNRWDSGVLMPGGRCQAWFVTPGTYEYLSIVAADGGTMRGTITVAGSLAD